MDKTTQDLAWSVLPKRNKVYCRNMYRTSHDGNVIDLLERLYGLHNLTSDAEVEEMMTVSRKRVQELYSSYCTERDEEEPGSNRSSLGGRIAMLQELFGSKCLPDETVSDCYQLTEPEPAEPKYHKGEKVYYNGYVYEVEGLVGKNRYALKGLNFDLHEDMIDPYDPHTEPQEENHIVENHEMVDNILKDGFSKERRLNIAAMVMQGILSNPTVMNGPELIDGDEEIAAMWSLKFADALIAEAEKGGSK